MPSSSERERSQSQHINTTSPTTITPPDLAEGDAGTPLSLEETTSLVGDGFTCEDFATHDDFATQDMNYEQGLSLFWMNNVVYSLGV